MYDPKFEKAIQQKMEELEFRPAESVWVNIEKAVVADHRRRGAGFFWRFLLPGLFVVAAAGVYIHFSAGKTTSRIATVSRKSTMARDAAVQPATLPPQTAQNAAVQGARSQTPGIESRAGQVVPATPTQVTTRNIPDRPSAMRSHLPATTPHRPDLAAAQYDPATAQYDPASGRSGQDAAADPTAQGHTSGSNNTLAALKAPSAWFYRPGLMDQRLDPQVHGLALTAQKNSISLTSLAQTKYHWEAGFAGSAGWSRLNRLNANQAQAAVTRMAASLYNINGSSSSKNYISETRPGASFDGGIYLQRQLSRRWIVNTGMSLHYYSNQISIGQQLSTYVNASASYLTPTVATAAQTTTMYASGNDQHYTNRYYFLELPVAIQWKVSQNRILPFFLEGGVSLSRLMGADALFYNAKTGLYSKDGDVVNKTQLNISSALLFGLPFHGVRIQLGPQIQYGLTPLVNTNGLGDQHLLYTGLRVVVIPGRR